MRPGRSIQRPCRAVERIRQLRGAQRNREIVFHHDFGQPGRNRSHDEDRRRDSGAAQRDSLLRDGDPQMGGATGQHRPGGLDQAVAEAVGLDHAHDGGRLHQATNVTRVLLNRRDIDLDPRRPGRIGPPVVPGRTRVRHCLSALRSIS